MRKVLVTGASGFVGQVLCKARVSRRFDVLVAVRSTAQPHSLKDVGGADSPRLLLWVIPLLSMGSAQSRGNCGNGMVQTP